MPITLNKFRFILKAGKVWKDFNKAIMCVSRVLQKLLGKWARGGQETN